MNKHKLFKELFNLANTEIYTMVELMELLQEAKTDFEQVGVEFSYEGFKAYAHRRHDPLLQTQHSSERSKKLLQIIDGDNLDAIEEAAEKRGL